VKQELKPEDIAIVLRPTNYEEDWDGDVDISLVMSEDTPVPLAVRMHILNMATMMSTFLDVAKDNPDIYEIVEERRNYLMGIEEDEEEGLDVLQDGNVYTLNKWTKTEGSA